MLGCVQARVLAVEELVELSQEDLLRMQENLALAMSKRMEMEMKVRRTGSSDVSRQDIQEDFAG